ncbi:AsmA family protein [Neolewinella agarilytica]|uniref:AsmA family protein n=1 Tax=Neolewinella agarilytica TaxID=478744 RepID=A0A1H8ZP91_9BACT|nr:AsmA-like C-terminal region-containing protein [Neolewinella agarilytica]SEP66222.1 AsmA family protein [Neolewinella agarilytica]
MKTIKRILIAIVLLLVIGIGFLLAAPIIFKDKIVANVKSSINQSLDAEVDFTDIDLSFLRSFPDISLSVSDLTVIGVDTFAGKPLATSESLEVDLGFWSVVAGDGSYVIDEVRLEKPVINLLVLNPELANYLVVPETGDTAPETSTAPATAQINLSHYEIHDGTFVYDDRSTNTYLKIEGLETEGDGDFTASIFDLDTYSTIEALTLTQGGVTYLNKVKAVADAMVNVDLDNSRYTFLDNKITLNALDLVFGGSIDLEDNDDILFDLTYEAPVNDFRQLWSLIPAAYTQGYEQVKTKGNFTLQGTVKGPFNSEEERYPAFTVNSNISGGSVQYPGRPVGINGIDAQVMVNSPSSDLNKLEVNIPRFDFDLGGDPFRGRFKMTTPISDPNIDAKVNGRIDLHKWSQAIPLEGVRDLGGVIVADITMDNVRQSLLDAGRYADVNLGGDVQISDFVYVADGLPSVKIASASADFTPQAINVADFQGNLGRSDIAASGKITTPLAYFSPEQTMRGDMVIRSNFFDADEWMPEEEALTPASPAEMAASSATETEETAIFDRFDFDIDAEIGELKYASYRPKSIRAIGNVKPNRMEIASAGATMGDSDFSGSGTVTNLFDYTFGEGILGGALSVRSKMLNLDDFMDEEAIAEAPAASSAEGEAAAAIPVPTNINLDVDVVADVVKYTNVTMENVLGQLLVQRGQAVIQDGSAALLGGRMNFAGAYDTSEPGDPGFRFHYDLQSLDFNQAFSTLNTFAALAPVGKFLQGQFSTDLVLEGKLGQDLFPKLGTIDAKGLFQTAEARLAQFKPAQKIGQALNIDELKNSTVIKNLMTVFKIEEGKVEIEPFTLKLAGMPLQVSGRHGLDMDMDYQIQAAIPREWIKGNIVTGTALSALDQLAGQAGKLGLNITPGDTLNVAINLGGNISDPTTSFKLLGTNGGEPQSVQDAVVGAVKDRVQDEVDTRREEATERVNEEVDKVKEDAQRRIDSLRAVATNRSQEIQDSIRRAAAAQAERLRQEAANKLKLQLDSARLDSIRRALPPGVNEAADKVKEELERFNPFKKKKTGGGE